ncbi:metallopeptidase family protein [Schaalia suimastitidis]|uniref:metallopeptidase family protein n=1 Tax=Schaalia suimastitidis TaxID=121163 RepID=UPI0004188AC3|nr:metallopeptidase family protein [Schaalia suimastitidis]
MPVEVSDDVFERLVDDGLDMIPHELLALLDNVVILIEARPGPDEPQDLLGLYDGVPLTERGDYAGVLPDRIFIYREPLLAMCDSEEELAEEVAITVVHEIAHFFGIEDEALHQMGWG